MFVGKGALDYGGPRREFFRLFCKSMENSEYLQGYRRCFFLTIYPETSGITFLICLAPYFKDRVWLQLLQVIQVV